MPNNHGTMRPTYIHAQNSDDTIHVVFVLYDPSGNYSQHAGVAMTSIFENTHRKVTVHILHDNTLTEENKQKFIRTAEKYSQAVNIINIESYKSRIGKRAENFLKDTITIGALYKLLIQDVVAHDKVIYLDCDILVNLDISELWNMDIEENFLAAAVDEIVVKRGIFDLLGVMCLLQGDKASSYINSGVLVMNLKKLREQNFFEAAIKWLYTHLHLAYTGDQDVFNSLLYGKIKLIEQKFNRQIWDSNTDLSETIIHTNKRKSWQVFPTMYADCFYWRMFLRSAWGEGKTTEDLIDILSHIKDKTINSPSLHKSYGQCLKRVISGAWNRITFLRQRIILKLIIKDMYYRIKYMIIPH